MLTMTTRLKHALQRRYESREGLYVFQGYGTASDRPRASTAALRRAMTRAGLNTPELVERYGRANAHTLRDTFASWLVQSGMSLFKVQRLLGHASPQMTMKYAKLEPRGVSDEAAAILDGLVEPVGNVVALRVA
jgi:integrase